MTNSWLRQRYFGPADGRDGVATGLRRLIGDLDLDHYSFGLHRRPHDPAAPCQPGGLASWPREWAERYAARRYCLLDPVCDLARRSHRPFLWGQGRFLRAFAKPQRRVLEEMRDFGLLYGLAIPVRCARGAVGALSVAAADPRRLREAVRGQHERLFAAAFDAHDFLLDRALDRECGGASDGRADAVLTVRERECLSWTLEGRTAAEIAAVLGLSAHTVNRHASSAARKLDCANKHHAAVRALREGLL